MATKKKKIKKTPRKQSKGISDGMALLVTMGTLCAIILGLYFLFEPPSPKFKTGDCLINRAFQPVKVVRVYTGLKEYALKEQKVFESHVLNGWFLENNGTGTYYRDLDFVDKHYTKVPCDQINP